MLQIDGSNSPDSISTEETEAFVVTNSAGRLGAAALSEGGSPASDSALTSGANSQSSENEEADRGIVGEHISLHLSGDLTFLMSGLSGQPDLSFNWTAMTEYRLFATDSRLFILIQNKDEDDIPPTAFHDFPDDEETPVTGPMMT